MKIMQWYYFNVFFQGKNCELLFTLSTVVEMAEVAMLESIAFIRVL